MAERCPSTKRWEDIRHLKDNDNEIAALAGTALLAIAAPVQAQPYPMGTTSTQPQAPIYQTVAPNWMQDDGSSSDHPVHMPGDISGERLNSQYRNGIDVPPGQGLPAGGSYR
jgi:hypothetical protein